MPRTRTVLSRHRRRPYPVIRISRGIPDPERWDFSAPEVEWPWPATPSSQLRRAARIGREIARGLLGLAAAAGRTGEVLRERQIELGIEGFADEPPVALHRYGRPR